MESRKLIGYVRIGPRERRGGRPELDEQREAIEAECRRRGWELVAVEADVRSGRTLRRPGLHAALDACRQGDAVGIVVARLDRLTYDVADLAYLVRAAVEGGFTIVALDLDVDLATEAARQLTRVLAEAAEWHPRSVGRRTRLALEQRRDARGRGRPSSTPPALASRIRNLRARGWTLQAICDMLNAEGVPTPRGGTHWRPTSLRAIVRPPAASESNSKRGQS